ncbi:hypothetical protein GCM10010406_53570 [Streptomyces thermolineatus]|uniref:Uncharacterized protein n=1 Tax=Streptomyces thermolineatus TaxID=44033 RepID=A0ABP6A4F3_9ACTN
MKPKPFSELNHFTVPVAIIFSFCGAVLRIRDARTLRRRNDPIRRSGKTKMRLSVTSRQAHTEFMGTKTATGTNVAHPPPERGDCGAEDFPRKRALSVRVGVCDAGRNPPAPLPC